MKSMIRKRTIALILAIFAIGLMGYTARGPIISAAFQWYFKGYCRTCLGGELSYDDVHHANGVWIFEHPRVNTKLGLEGGGYRFKADKAILKASVSWIKHTIDFTISLETPHLDVGKGGQELKKIFQHSCEDYRLFHVHTHFDIPQGSALVHNFLDGENIPFYFSLNLACKEAHEGCASFWLDHRNHRQPDLHIGLSNLPTNVPEVHFAFHAFDGAALMQMLKELYPDLSRGVISKGIVNGKVSMFMPEGAVPYYEGSLALQGVSLSYPLIECGLEIPEAAVEFTPQQTLDKNGLADGVQTTGIIKASSGAQVVFAKEGMPYWTIDVSAGSLDFKSAERAVFNLDGLCTTHEQQRLLKIDGEARFADPGQDSLEITLLLQGNENQNDVNIDFSARELGEEWRFAEIQLAGISRVEFDLVKLLVGRVYPDWEKINVIDGSADLSMLVYLHRYNITEVKIENIAVHHLQFASDAWELYGEIDEAWGLLSFDLSVKEPIETLNTDLNIIKGKIHLGKLIDHAVQFANIHTNLKVRHGIFQKSLIKGTFAGLHGEVVLDGTSSGPLAKFDFGGNTSDVMYYLPETLWEGLDVNFKHDQLKLTASARSNSGGLVFDGMLDIIDVEGSYDKIAFGFALEKASQIFFGEHFSRNQILESIPGANLDAIQLFLPDFAVLSGFDYEELIKQKFGLASFVIKDGWFEANNLRLNKYLSSFIFPRNQLRVSGHGNFRGIFDEQGSVINYDMPELFLENEDMAMELKSYSPQERFRGVYVLGFTHDRNYGSFPITNGTYFEKNSGLLFTDVNANVSLQNDMAHFTEMETFCNGVYFAGAIDLNWSMPGDGFFDVDIKARTMHGKISQIQHIFSHFTKSLFLGDLPLEGNIDFHRAGGLLHFGFNPNGYDFQAHTEGSISDAKLLSSMDDFHLQEVAMNFVYDHAANALDFSDIQGTLLIGPPKHMEEYSVASDALRFTDYKNNEAEFDIWVGDKKRDIIRIAGKTQTLSEEKGQSYIDFKFDHRLSHFGDVHPSIFELTLKDWTQIENFRLEFDFNLQTLLSDLQRFSRSGMFFLSRSILKEINALNKAEGEFNAAFSYDGKRSVFDYNLSGNNVLVGTHRFKKFLFLGAKKGSTWTVDQLQLDDISLAVDIEKNAQIWNINFFGARFGKSLLLGLEGKFDSENALLEAKVNLLEADMAYLNEWTSFHKSLDGLQLGGQLHATGGIRLELDRSFPSGMHIDLQAQGNLQGGKIKGLDLDDIKNISLRYTSERGLTINDLKTSLKSAKDGNQRADLFLKSVICDFANHEWAIRGLGFKLPAANLNWLVDNLQQSFPEALTPPIADVIRCCKTQGELSGEVNLAFSETHSGLKLSLSDDAYQFIGNEHHLKGFSLDYDPFSFKIFSQYEYKKKRLGIQIHSLAPDFDAGELVITDLSTPVELPNLPLTVHWQIDPLNGYYIHAIEGSLCGLKCNLKRDLNRALAADNLYLFGSVDLDIPKAQALLDPTFADKIASWELGKGYTIHGQWNLNKDDMKPFSERLTFQGELLGKDFELFGYRFATLAAHLTHFPRSIELHRLLLSDQNASMQIDEIMCSKQGNQEWKAVIPRITIRELCPSLLHAVKSNSPREKKTLLINHLEINDLKGIVGDRNSFKGSGQLIFSNPPKKNLQHTILAIPAEILTRIGLDLEVLTPVKGTIEYEIQDGKVALKHFKDVFSKKRVSKFYLADNNNQSYVDFDGNLHLHVRMKQYNLIFKLAELFTVTIQGTLKKPTYTLQRQPHEPEDKKRS